MTYGMVRPALWSCVAFVAICGVVAVFSAVVWGSPWSIVEALSARPLFGTWRNAEGGAHWKTQVISAECGLTVYVDAPRNIVLICTVPVIGEYLSITHRTITVSGNQEWTIPVDNNRVYVLSSELHCAAVPDQFAACVWRHYAADYQANLRDCLRDCAVNATLLKWLANELRRMDIEPDSAFPK